LTTEFKVGKGTVPTLVGVKFVPSTLNDAVQRFLSLLYSVSDSPVDTKVRNTVIRQRYEAGEGLSALGREFGLKPQRIYQIVHRNKEVMGALGSLPSVYKIYLLPPLTR
jgi:hypothetical protein